MNSFRWFICHTLNFPKEMMYINATNYPLKFSQKEQKAKMLIKRVAWTTAQSFCKNSMRVDKNPIYSTIHDHSRRIWAPTCRLQSFSAFCKCSKIIPMPGIEPGPRGWKPRTLTTRPHGTHSWIVLGDLYAIRWTFQRKWCISMPPIIL